jgi:hypothetical protein
MFGLLALEGGVVYWTGYYLLHASGVHKGLAVIALSIDALLSGIGFFYEMETMTHSVGTVQLPPIIVVVAGAVLFNVAMSLLSHLIPSGPYIGPRPHEEAPYVTEYHPARLEQRATASDERQPGLLKNAAASAIAASQDIVELAREKRKQRKELEPVSLSHSEPSPAKEPEPVRVKKSLPPLRHHRTHRPFIQAQPANPSQAPLKNQASQ